MVLGKGESYPKKWSDSKEKFEKMVLDGATQSQLIDEFDITKQTLSSWRRKVELKHNKLIVIPGGTDGRVRTTMKYGKGRGITISEAKLENSDFKPGDEFKYEIDENRIILTKI